MGVNACVCLWLLIYVNVYVYVWGRGEDSMAPESRNNMMNKHMQLNIASLTPWEEMDTNTAMICYDYIVLTPLTPFGSFVYLLAFIFCLTLEVVTFFIYTGI